ncbi:nuclear transport factor 2 family protein [Antrihabitans sp. YC2-6]|uniref:nuclear transport factor 2 family protein n=1 Tax=Antrihabitans sp. YC2-6 TaxID=2799498 RepID=UPI0018F3A544|nr:nuclear transport factor 2 family protein [Antrihabitans sp. YC2-6]MBJ8346786.1 nuclear transport factor 2 family protein [Antrihabitans sp. YC2-6]
MASAEQMRDVVEKYVKLVGAGATEEIVALYRADASVEDPVGTEQRIGTEAIREFYKILEPLEKTTELTTARIAGSRAAFLFTLRTKVGEQTLELSPIDVMEFDDDGKISSMKAFWGQDDMHMS